MHLTRPGTSCRPIVPFLFISNSIAISIIQAILVIRVWHLFSNNRKIQIMIITMFGTSVVLAMGFTIDSAVRIRFQSTGVVLDKLRILGCRLIGRISFGGYIFLRCACILFSCAVLKRLLRDGGFFYFVVFVLVGVSTVGSFMEDFAQLNVVVAYSK
ncbi:hypothetical protein CPB85DRAFT_1449660 [Mucidula mucida]|nr:hypothetical protein CPB85DRAFT_1449660 [Mucidula mucida]